MNSCFHGFTRYSASWEKSSLAKFYQLPIVLAWSKLYRILQYRISCCFLYLNISTWISFRCESVLISASYANIELMKLRWKCYVWRGNKFVQCNAKESTYIDFLSIYEKINCALWYDLVYRRFVNKFVNLSI